MKAPYSALVIALFSAVIYAQPGTPQPTPVPPGVAKQASAATPALAPNERAELQKIPLGQAVQALQADEPRIVVDRRPAAATPDASTAGTASKSAPRSYQKSNTRLSATASAAVASARPWINGRNAPGRGEDGRVVYVFGKGMPEIVCAPLRICTLELQPGEVVVAEPQIGDAVRWHVTPSVYGQGAKKTELVVIKPQELGLDTNLVLTTNRRVYYIRLVADQSNYMPRVAFAYPDEERKAWEEHIAERERREESKVATVGTSVDNLNFNYAIQVEKGDGSFITPQRVFDDGQKTYIQLPPGAEVRETPALMLVGPGGTLDMVNYRVKGNTYVVDRLFDKAVLVLDVGSKQRRVAITSGAAKPSSYSSHGGSAWNNGPGGVYAN